MNFIDKLKDIPAQVKHIRESVTAVRPSEYGSLTAVEAGERLHRPSGRDWNHRCREFAKFVADCKTGRRPYWHLQEAMTTSDFPKLFADLLYRQMLGSYQPWPVTYPNWCRLLEVRDFRALHLYALDGGQGLLPKVKELEAYKEVSLVESDFSVKVDKYGQRYGISFEMIINDDLNAFNSRPVMMATGARRSEEYLATNLLCDANGPNATFFTAGHKNLIAGNPAFTIQGLQAGYSLLSSQVDKDGQPIFIDAVELVVPPQLKVTAENILKAQQLRINGNGFQVANGVGAAGGATMDQYLYTENWMSGRVRLNVNPYLPYISTAVKNGVVVGKNAWYMIANPRDAAQRPAFAFATMVGRKEPQLFYKDSDARMLGGGVSDPQEGSFDNDAIDYKIRHIFGGAQIDPLMACASDGTEA